MTEPDIQRYLDRIELQHSIRPKFTSLAAALLEKLDSAHGLMKDLPALYDVYTAAGKQLDAVGETLGVIRKDIPELVPNINAVPDDGLFRAILLCKIAQDNWDGTNEGLEEIWDATARRLFEMQYSDNQDMSIDVTVMGHVEPDVAVLLDNEYIIPKPAGVRLNTTVHEEDNFEHLLCAGIALYGSSVIDFGTAAMPDLTGIYLADETDTMLADENGTAIGDE